MQSLVDVLRVLKRTGTLRCIEHVRADGLLGYAQDLMTPIQCQLGTGCHPNRRTAERIAAAELIRVELQQQHLPLTPLIIEMAVPKQG